MCLQAVLHEDHHLPQSRSGLLPPHERLLPKAQRQPHPQRRDLHAAQHCFALCAGEGRGSVLTGWWRSGPLQDARDACSHDDLPQAAAQTRGTQS